MKYSKTKIIILSLAVLIAVALFAATALFLSSKKNNDHSEVSMRVDNNPGSIVQEKKEKTDNAANEDLVVGSRVEERREEDKKKNNPALPTTFKSGESSPISGLVCAIPENKDRRPIAVMLAADKRVRPLSGIEEADIVYEMPVITNMITRLMAVFVCNSPREIGSIRSARHDYLTLAKGLDAVLAHWGGSHFALDMLKNKKTVPDLDAMKSGGGAFYRKAGISAPDNGFASYDGLYAEAAAKGYRMENQFSGFPHRNESPIDKRGSNGTLTVGFPGVFRVTYDYDAASNTYLRNWNGNADTDRATGKRIAPKNVVVVFAASRQIEGQYNDVDIEGSGLMYAYMEGREFKGTWEKSKDDCVLDNDLVCVSSSRMKFIKDNGQEIEFVPGQIWVEVLEPGQVLRWTPA